MGARMSEDHLDRETAVSFELTETGVKAAAKSRLVAAFDRFGGSVFDAASAHIEARTAKRRAKTDGEVKLIETISQYGVERLGAHPEEAERAFQRHFRKVLKEQENTDGVMQAALEDLRNNPPDEEASQNEEPLSEEFLDRMEGYSATASTEELRHRWGRVLASEIRKPGTFSGKVLRVVDELDSETALHFEKVAKHRLSGLLPKALIGEIPYNVLTNLVLAGLIVEPGIAGQIVYFDDVQDDERNSLKFLAISGVGAVSFPATSPVKPGNQKDAALTLSNDKAALPCFLLTDSGQAIASILPDQQFSALAAYAQKLAECDALDWVRMYRPHGNGFQLIGKISEKNPPTEA